jgi:hypothetical protein
MSLWSENHEMGHSTITIKTADARRYGGHRFIAGDNYKTG